MLPIAVLVSGSGSNLQALIDATSPDCGYSIVLVIADRPGIRGLERAATAGIATEIVAWSDHDDREAFTKAVCDAAAFHGADALVLAGFMRILSPHAMTRFPERILNIHPALLPAFPGAHAVPEALDHGVKLTGVTVHFVDEEVDHGPIALQEAVEVLPGDDHASLHARIQRVEHRVYPRVVSALAKGELHIDGRLVTWKT